MLYFGEALSYPTIDGYPICVWIDYLSEVVFIYLFLDLYRSFHNKSPQGSL